MGGSLITEKLQPHTPLPQVIRRLAQEIAEARQAQPGLSLVLGHGSGSFGHVPGRKHGTRTGVRTPAEWLGFAEVWWEARQLNQLVLAALVEAGLPAIAFPISAGALTHDRQLSGWSLGPIQAALNAGLVPVVAGDVTFDECLGGTILSTEEIFIYLASQLHPEKILLAGVEPGVWQDYPTCTRLQPVITPQSLSQASGTVVGSAAVDVTGGMAAKVEAMIDLVQEHPGLEACIFSGREPGALRDALSGTRLGTTIRRD